MKTQPLEIQLPDARRASALLVEPEEATRLLYVLGHGAGAGMTHPFLGAVAERLARRGIATLRYQFPYMDAGRRSPDAPRVLESTVRRAIETAAETAPDLTIIAGGKSMGGRITSHVAAVDPPPHLGGLVFLGYPLHAPKKPDTKRARHLGAIRTPMLFLQGTRDNLADLGLVQSVVEDLGQKATLQVIDGGDHSFKVLKRSGRTETEVICEIVDSISEWAKSELQV